MLLGPWPKVKIPQGAPLLPPRQFFEALLLLNDRTAVAKVGDQNMKPCAADHNVSTDGCRLFANAEHVEGLRIFQWVSREQSNAKGAADCFWPVVSVHVQAFRQGANNISIAAGKPRHIRFLQSDQVWLPSADTCQLLLVGALANFVISLLDVIGHHPQRSWLRRNHRRWVIEHCG